MNNKNIIIFLVITWNSDTAIKKIMKLTTSRDWEFLNTSLYIVLCFSNLLSNNFKSIKNY